MRGLGITQDNLTNQQGVVKNEVKVNVLNQPYGGFPWLDLPQFANTNWYNAHNFYGDLEGPGRGDPRRRAAVLQDLLRAEQCGAGRHRRHRSRHRRWPGCQKYFGGIPAASSQPQPDIAEPRQEKEKRTTKADPLATTPGPGFRLPHAAAATRRSSTRWALIDQLLSQGKDSRLYQALVRKNGLTGEVDGGINDDLGNMFDIKGPVLCDGLPDSRRGQVAPTRS